MSDPTPDTILVVDDQTVSRALVKRMLEVAGYTVTEAESGETALEIARTSAIDAVVLDLKMPGIGGLETCRRLRAMEQYKVTPILVVTALEETEALAEAFDAGCDDFIAKPITSFVLEARLKGHLHRAELYHELERLRRTLNRYLSPRTREMAERYSRTGTLPTPERIDACLLFSDIRDFTHLSHSIDPEELFDLLSGQLGAQVELIYQFGGYVDKYAGDGVMAVFEGEDRTARGCRCALQIAAQAHSANHGRERQPFSVGCGIHQGSALIGNIGSPEHLDYSVVGESVNLAARLCGHAEPMSVIASETVYHAAKDEPDLHFANRRVVDIKGFDEPVAIFDVEPRS